jgi:ABC-type Fe3+-siderophore transport system permease subunit
LKVGCHSLLRQKLHIKTLNRKPMNSKNIITVVSGAAVFVVMNIVIVKIRHSSDVRNVRRKLPRGSYQKE